MPDELARCTGIEPPGVQTIGCLCRSAITAKLVDQWGFQPQSQRPERCALCDWTTGRELWRGHEESNLNRNVRSVPSCPLNDTRERNGWRARLRTWNLSGQSRLLRQLSYAPMAAGRGIEPRKPASKAGGLPLTEPAQTGVTGENRTLVVGATIQRLSHSATVTSGACGSARISVSGFSGRR